MSIFTEQSCRNFFYLGTNIKRGTLSYSYKRPSPCSNLSRNCIEIDLGQRAATTKSILADAGDIFGNRDACQRATYIECLRTNACDTFGDHDACQRATSIECLRTNACDTFGDHNLGQIAFITKYLFFYRYHTGAIDLRRNRIRFANISAKRQTGKIVFGDHISSQIMDHNTFDTRIITLIAASPIDAKLSGKHISRETDYQARAYTKGIIADLCYAFGNQNA